MRFLRETFSNKFKEKPIINSVVSGHDLYLIPTPLIFSLIKCYTENKS